jgi:hypothetical protein
MMAKDSTPAAPGSGCAGGASGGKEKNAWGSAQAFEKARSGQENPRKSKLFPLIFFARPWLDFAGFG